MKKFDVQNPFSLLERVLILPGDDIYAQLILEMYHVYSGKTRKRLGKISKNSFLEFVKEA